MAILTRKRSLGNSYLGQFVFSAVLKLSAIAQFCGRKTAKCFVIALAHADGSQTNAISGASLMGDFLDASGY